MSSPLIWERYDNFVICDVKEDWDEKLKNFMVENYIANNPLYQLLNCYGDEKFEADYRRLLDHIFLDRCCLIIMEETSERIVGAAIMKLMTIEMKSWVMLRLVSDSEKMNIFIHLRRTLLNEYRELNKGNADALHDSMHLFEYYVLPNDKESLAAGINDWTPKLLDCVVQVTRHMKVPGLTFMAMTKEEQEAVQAVQFIELSKTLYITYIDGGTRPFLTAAHIGQLHVMIYGKYVQPVKSYEEMKIFGAEKDAEEREREAQKKAKKKKKDRRETAL